MHCPAVCTCDRLCFRTVSSSSPGCQTTVWWRIKPRWFPFTFLVMASTMVRTLSTGGCSSCPCTHTWSCQGCLTSASSALRSPTVLVEENSLTLCTLTLWPEILRGWGEVLTRSCHSQDGGMPSTPWQLIQKWVPTPTVCLVGISQFCNQRLAAKTWYLLHDVFPFRNPVVITLLLSCLHHLAKALTPLVAP